MDYDYQEFIQKNLRLPYIHHIVVADLQGNTIAQSNDSQEEEAVMSSFLYQNAIQAGEEFGLSEFRNISFEHGECKCIITEKREVLVLVMVDKNISDSKYLSYLDQILN